MCTHPLSHLARRWPHTDRTGKVHLKKRGNKKGGAEGGRRKGNKLGEQQVPDISNNHVILVTGFTIFTKQVRKVTGTQRCDHQGPVFEDTTSSHRAGVDGGWAAASLRCAGQH